MVDIELPHPDERRRQQLQRRHQAGRQMGSANMGSITKLHNQRNQINDHCSKKVSWMMQLSSTDVANKKTRS